jgi:hypothetical protein
MEEIVAVNQDRNRLADQYTVIRGLIHAARSGFQPDWPHIIRLSRYSVTKLFTPGMLASLMRST